MQQTLPGLTTSLFEVSQTNMIILQVYLIAGRTVKQKEKLVEALTKAAATTLEVDNMAVQIVIKDLPNTDFGLAGKTAKSLGRGIGRAEMLDNR